MEVRPVLAFAFHVFALPKRSLERVRSKSAATRNAVLPLECALSSAHWADGPAGTPA